MKKEEVILVPGTETNNNISKRQQRRMKKRIRDLRPHYDTVPNVRKIKKSEIKKALSLRKKKIKDDEKEVKRLVLETNKVFKKQYPKTSIPNYSRETRDHLLNMIIEKRLEAIEERIKKTPKIDPKYFKSKKQKKHVNKVGEVVRINNIDFKDNEKKARKVIKKDLTKKGVGEVKLEAILKVYKKSTDNKEKRRLRRKLRSIGYYISKQ